MGCVVGCLATMASCCFGSSACRLCCSCLPACRNSMSTRLSYCGMLVVGSIICLLSLAHGLHESLRKIPYICNAAVFPDYTDVTFACDIIVGYEVIYRICFAMSCFYLLFALIMVRVRSSDDPRAKLQNGYWFFKCLLMIGLSVGAFFIPYGDTYEPNFIYIWMWIGMIGAVGFIIVQLMLLIDTVHRWNASWIERGNSTGNCCWKASIVFFALLFYSITIASVVFFFMYYAKSGCTEHQMFVSVDIFLIMLSSFISILGPVRKRLRHSGLLQSSAVSAYGMYVTWSAMSNNPDQNCNPNLIRHLILDVSSAGMLTNKSSVAFENKTAANVTVSNAMATTANVDSVTIITILIWLSCLIFSCFRSSRSRTPGASFSPNKAEPVVSSSCENNCEAGQTVLNDEKEETPYSYSLFHIMLMLSSMYIMMTLTNWFSLSSDLTSLNTNVAAMWVKISTAWCAFFLYIVSLLVPMVWPSRFE